MADTTEPTPGVWALTLPDLAATERLAAALADEIRTGDLVTLSGGLGSGKTTFARFLIRRLLGQPDLEVPSPTFTLMQVYESEAPPIVHADLYRIGNPRELIELGWEEYAERGAVTLVEWPERGEGVLDRARLDVALELSPGDGPDARLAVLSGTGDFAPRLDRLRALTTLLDRSGWTGAERMPVQGDASTRAYERLVRDTGETAILMISPRRPDGPPVRRGKPYSAIARLAESVHAFAAVDRGLRALGFSAPKIYGEDLESGLLILEDLGSEGVTDEAGPIPERYAEAARLLAKLHATTLPNVLPIAEGEDHVVPSYDLDAMLIEAELLADWYVPHILGALMSGSARAEFVNAWTETLQEVLEGPQTWVLRDYHSPNLIWLPEREGVKRVGLLDFQDAVLGPPGYDVVSLLQDARIDVPADLELKLLGHYVRERKGAETDFDMAAFARAYAIMGAQRATKILGIFARLDKRDGKPQYLRHLPRIEAYLARNLAHPALAKLRGWYGAYLPGAAGLGAE
jgi:hypothetical protein